MKVPTPKTSKIVVSEVIVAPNNDQEQQKCLSTSQKKKKNVNDESTIVEPQGILLRISQREVNLLFLMTIWGTYKSQKWT